MPHDWRWAAHAPFAPWRACIGLRCRIGWPEETRRERLRLTAQRSINRAQTIRQAQHAQLIDQKKGAFAPYPQLN